MPRLYDIVDSRRAWQKEDLLGLPGDGMAAICSLVFATLQLKIVLTASQATNNDCNGICGRRPLAASNNMLRIIAGTDALPGTWPWQASFQIETESGFVNTCGGTLLNSRWVLTAAHCFQIEMHIPWYKVVLGLNRISQPGPDVQTRFIKRVINHELYENALNVTDGGVYHDISLVELSEPVSCNDYIQPACLPDKSVTVSKLSHCSISGWGTMEGITKEKPDVLQEGTVRLIPYATCSSFFWWHKRVRAEQLCAGHEEGGIKTCQGDSGGPLMCREARSERYWVVGITSWGTEHCTGIQKPSIFTSTQNYLNWITKMTGEDLLKPSQQPLLAQVWSSTKPPTQSNTQEVPNEIWKRPRPPLLTLPPLEPTAPPRPTHTPNLWLPAGFRPLPSPTPPPFFGPKFTPGPSPPPIWKTTSWHTIPWTNPPRWIVTGPMGRRTRPTYRPWTGPAIWGLTRYIWTTPRQKYYQTSPFFWYGMTWSTHPSQQQLGQNIAPPGSYLSYSWNPGFGQPGNPAAPDTK